METTCVDISNVGKGETNGRHYLARGINRPSLSALCSVTALSLQNENEGLSIIDPTPFATMSNQYSKPGAPKTSQNWMDEAKNRGVLGATIHSAVLASASNFEFDQFLLLRVLWRQHELPEVPNIEGLSGLVTQATKMLDQYKSWRTYCESIGSEESPEGTFAIARYYQREVARTEEKADPQAFNTPISSRTRAAVNQVGKGMAGLSLGPPETPTKKGPAPLPGTKSLLDDSRFALDHESSPSSISSSSPSPIHLATPITRELANILYPPTKDEQIVNTALIVFLNALTIHFCLSSKWTLHRKPFIATFKNAKFEARTDGYLDSPGGKPRVLIEVKPVLRSLNLLAIQMQESAQMVAWIKSDTESAQKRNTTYAYIPCFYIPGYAANSTDRRFHISQDRHLVYVTVARYDQTYLEYLVHGKLSKDGKDDDGKDLSFMTMDQYGPWDTTDRAHMRRLGPLLLAITLRAEKESEKEKVEDKKRHIS